MLALLAEHKYPAMLKSRSDGVEEGGILNMLRAVFETFNCGFFRKNLIGQRFLLDGIPSSRSPPLIKSLISSSRDFLNSDKCSSCGFLVSLSLCLLMCTLRCLKPGISTVSLTCCWVGWVEFHPPEDRSNSTKIFSAVFTWFSFNTWE